MDHLAPDLATPTSLGDGLKNFHTFYFPGASPPPLSLSPCVSLYRPSHIFRNLTCNKRNMEFSPQVRVSKKKCGILRAPLPPACTRTSELTLYTT